MAELSFGSLSLTTSPARDNFAALRHRFIACGQKHRRLFNARYEVLDDIDAVFEQMQADLSHVSGDVTSMIAEDLANHRIYDVSEQTIRTDLEARAEDVAERFKQVQERYFSILDNAAALEADRRSARDNRGQIVGGGFGVEGAARGIAVAAMANAAINMTHGVANLATKAAANRGDKAAKRRLFTDPETKTALGDFLVRIALQGAEQVAATVNTRTGSRIFDTVSDESRGKSLAIVENIGAGRVPGDEVQASLVQAIRLDPFNEAAWRIWLDRFGDRSGSVSASADRIGVGAAKAHKARLFEKRKASLPWQTPDECRTSMATLEPYGEWLGLSFNEERESIDARIVRLETAQRTFNGVEYASFAEAANAREAHEDEMKRTVQGRTYDTHEGAESARAQAKALLVESSRANNLLGWIILPYKRFRDVKGRSSSIEFISFISLAIVAIILSVALQKSSALATILTVILLFTTAVCGFTLEIRRFHDQNRSGLFILLNLVPYVGWLIVLALLCFPGTPGDNRFGPDPLDR